MAIERQIIPDVSLFGKLGARSRALPMVATELVDNSLDSWIAMPKDKKKGKKLHVEISATTGKDAWFIIKDNAGGMSQQGLIDALTVAKSSKTNDSRFIGHFGLGLKSAVMYIGSKFRIYTMSYDKPKVVYFVEFDKVKFENSKEWKLKFDEIPADEAAKMQIYFPDKHGTEIHVFNERYSPGSKNSIINRLRRVFGPRLPKSPKLKIDSTLYNEDMKITFGEDTIIAAGPFYEVWDNSVKRVEEETQSFLKKLKKDQSILKDLTIDYIKGSKDQLEAAIIPSKIKWFEEIPGVLKIPEKKIAGKRVWGRIGILDRGMAHNNKYGFDLIKNGRVVEENVLDKELRDREIGIMASNHNARIAGQLFLDDWTTDHQKTSFLKDSKDWNELTEYVSSYAKKLHKISSLLQNPNKYFRDTLKMSDENAPEFIADKKFEEKIPDIQKGVQQAVRSSAVKTAITSLEKNREKHVSTKPSQVAKSGTHKTSPQKLNSEKPEKDTESTSKIIYTKPQIKFTRKGDDNAMVFTKLTKDKSGNVLEITLNRDHPFLAQRESAELTAIGEFLTIDYFASYIVSNKKQFNHEDFINLRDELLKNLNLKK